MAEGDSVVVRVVRAGYRLVSLLVDATRTQPLPPELEGLDAIVLGAGPEVLRRITGLGVHRGCLGVLERRPLPAVADILDGCRRLLVLESVVNPVNLGVICRSAVGLGMDALLLDDASVDPLYRRASRVAMGEVFDFPYTRAGRFPDGLAPVRDAGFTLVALTPADDATPIDELRLGADERVASGARLGRAGPHRCDDGGVRSACLDPARGQRRLAQRRCRCGDRLLRGDSPGVTAGRSH